MPKKVANHQLPDFWETYPDAGLIKPFEALRNKRGDHSSNLMWFIRFMHDPTHEFVREIPKHERETMLRAKLAITKADTDSALFAAADAWYKNEYLPYSHRQYALIMKKIKELDDAMDENVTVSPREAPELVQAFQARATLVKEMEQAKLAMEADIAKAKDNRQRMYGKEETVRPADDGSMF